MLSEVDAEPDDEITSSELDTLLDDAATLAVGRPPDGTLARRYSDDVASSSHRHGDEPSALERLAREGVIRLPERKLSDVLAARGPLRGPVTDAGSRAVAEQRGERA